MTGRGAPRLQIRDVRKTFEGKKPVEALAGVSMSLAANEFVSLVGTSGCGKSTLLSIVAGLIDPSGGDVLVDGASIDGPGRDRGVVFQTYTLFPWLTARENVAFALRGEKMSTKARREVADEHLALVGLESFADAQPRQLSGGMKQRVAIARALSYKPSILLMDEPFGALDAQTRLLMQELLTRVWESHRLTVLFVTHDVEEAVYLSDRVFVMTNRPGRLKDEVRIDLPRPRAIEQQEAPEFLELRRRILASIREESLRVEPGIEEEIRA
ncbi:MAG: ABC transporter ATP-binding protein [Chloroflexi bacterium]|nr:ABC transporter ATP-binding protein [Chloroflexota bacterium]